MAFELTTEIDIQASPEKIWAILTDFNQYPNWNPFITSLKGDFVVGKQIEVTIARHQMQKSIFSNRRL